jgi:hypothetical protein
MYFPIGQKKYCVIPDLIGRGALHGKSTYSFKLIPQKTTGWKKLKNCWHEPSKDLTPLAHENNHGKEIKSRNRFLMRCRKHAT